MDRLEALRLAVEAGLYRRDSRADGEPFLIPWLSARCGDCPFWSASGVCQIRHINRAPDEATCRYFDVDMREVAAHSMHEARANGEMTGIMEEMWDDGNGNFFGVARF